MCKDPCCHCCEILPDIIAQRDEARIQARDYFRSLDYMGEYLFRKHYGRDVEDFPWLEGASPYPPKEP